MMRSTSIRAVKAAVVALVLAAHAGCGYTIRTPHDRTIRTVYVPIFRQFSFRKEVNLQLTEQIIKEIERRTPYKVVGTPEGADTTLEGTITIADKSVMVENPNNLPRHLIATIAATVNWTDNRPGVDKKPDPPAYVNENVFFYPELGETAQLGFQKAINRMAQQIVDMMEKRW